MFGLVHQFRALAIKGPSKHIGQVRWRVRKPFWLGTAKSKIFRVPIKPDLPPEEEAELMRLFNHYRTVRKSLDQFLVEKHSVLRIEKSDTELLHKSFLEDFERCSAINDEWNKKLAEVREERIKEELEREVQRAKRRIENVAAKKLEQRQQAEERVRREKEVVGTFITVEQLDEVIDKAIENPTEYNYAIDQEGNRYVGRETIPEIIQTKQRASN